MEEIDNLQTECERLQTCLAISENENKQFQNLFDEEIRKNEEMTC